MSQLLKCSHCSPWAQALQQIVSDAGENPKKKNWTAANLTPSTWPDPTLGPFAIAKAFVKPRLEPDACIANADATCLLNILRHYPSVSQHLSPAAVRTNLEALQTVRNKGIGHWHKPELSSDRTQEYLGVCKSVLEAGPWTKGDYKDGTEQALHKVVAGYSRAMELLPPLEQLRRHFVPQVTPLAWLSQALQQGHRVIALCGLGGIGKSTTALAWCWKQVLGGTLPGQHGVLWASAAAPSGGIDGALATVVQTRLGMVLSPTEATNPAVVRQRLQCWARHREESWLLVLDNVEPDCQERSLLGLLGDHGVALLTTRAGPKALHRDMDVVRAAALRLECLSPDDGYTLMLARWGGEGTSLAASEEAAVRELAGGEALSGLPLAMEQAAALVSSVAGKTFAELLKEFKEGSGAKVLPGDDDGAGSLARTLTAAVTSCGLQGVAGLVDQLLQECESLDDVQWLEAKHIVWGAPGADGTPRAPSVVQRAKFAALKKACSEQSMSARHKHTVATVWAAQLSVLPKYCVEVLQGAAWFAPEHIPQSVLVRALEVWVEAAAGGSGSVEKFAAGSALVGEVKQRLAGGGATSDVRAAVAEVVEAALQWLDDVSLVHRGVWMSAEDIHDKFGSAQFKSFRHAGNSSSSDGGATGGAGSGAGAGGSNDAQDGKPRPWLSMHRLVQSVVTGSGGVEGVPIGVHVLGSLRSVMDDAVKRFKDVMKGAAAGSDSMDDMELAAWLVAYDHATSCVSSAVPHVGGAGAGSSEFRDAVTALVGCVASLCELVVDLGLLRGAEAWRTALKLGLAWLKEGGGGDSSTMAHVLRRLGGLERASSHYDEAEPLLEQALSMYRRLHGDGDSSDVAKSLSSVGALCMDQSRYTEAEPLLVQALTMYQRLHDGSDSSEVALALDSLAVLHWRCSRYGKAEDLVVQALAMVQRLANGRDSSDVAKIVNNLALVYEAQSRYDEAEPLYVQALAMDQRLHGDSDSSAVASSLNNLADLYESQSRYDEAEPLYVQALAMEQRLHGDSDSSDVALSLNNLAYLYQAQSRYDEAEPLLAQSLAIEQRLHGGSDSSDVARALNNLASLYQAQSRYDEAEPLLAQSLAMKQRLHGGSDSSAVAASLNNLALLYKAQSRYDEADPLFVQALAMEQRLHGDSDSSAVALSLNNLAYLYMAQSRYDEAEPLMAQALAMEQRLHGGSDSSAVAPSLVGLAACLMNQHRYTKAEPLLQQAVEMLKRLAGGKDSADVAEAVTRLADLYCRQSRFKKARPLIERALDMCERLHIADGSLGDYLRLLAAQCQLSPASSSSSKTPPEPPPTA